VTKPDVGENPGESEKSSQMGNVSWIWAILYMLKLCWFI